MTRQLLNTLFVQTQGTYLRLDHDAVRIEIDEEPPQRVPLHHLGGIVVFGNVLISPYLLHRCAEDRRQVVWMSRSGRFRARLHGPISGNVLLRRVQHEASCDAARTRALAEAFVKGKLLGARQVLLRAQREAEGSLPDVRRALRTTGDALEALPEAADVETVRGIEGQAAAEYFRALPALIRNEAFPFSGRNKRPPRDAVNAVLSFVYTLVRGDCNAALEGVGLDPQVGFLHVLRPGRPALALDLMEEFRAWWADRLVLTLLNRKQLRPKDFEEHPGGAVLLSEDGRKAVLTAYQKRKGEEVRHPLFKEPVPVGLVPYVQARLLARHLRGDLDRYVSFTPK